MAWLIPAALSGLALVAAPIVIHLLTRQRAPRVRFPSVRFVRPSIAAAVRLRRPGDLRLLCVRAAILAFAALAAAQPLLLTSWRLASWNGRLARVVVVDTSESMRRVDPTGGVPAALAEQSAKAETVSAFHAARIETADLADGLTRAVRLLEGAPPAKREVVIVSDFQLGALSATAFDAVPSGIGIRFVKVGLPVRPQAISGRAVTGWRGAQWTPSVQVDPLATQTTWQRAPRDPVIGVSMVTAPGEEAFAAAALRAAASFGTPVHTDRPVRVTFPGAHGVGASARPLHTPWIVNTVLALRRSDARESVTRAAEQDGILILGSSAPVASVAAAALLRAVTVARAEPVIAAEAEVARIPDDDLARWQREPSPIDASLWPRAESTDARWLWLVSLVLLALESWMRRRRGVREETRVDATAA
jgi:hypothetical protein